VGAADRRIAHAGARALNWILDLRFWILDLPRQMALFVAEVATSVFGLLQARKSGDFRYGQRLSRSRQTAGKPNLRRSLAFRLCGLFSFCGK
jgi:hypothetical protein